MYLGVKNRLREIRMKEYMMNPGEFSKHIGTDIKNYNNWESNRSKPKLELAMSIALKLNKNIEEIWYFE